MKKFHSFVLWLFIVISFSGCTPEAEINSLFDNSPLASPCIVSKDSVKVILRDYFPKMENKDTVLITVNNGTPFLSLLEVLDKDQKATLLVVNLTENKIKGCDRKYAPYITTETLKDENAFVVKTLNGVKELAVFWQNTILEEKFVKPVNDSSFVITIPHNAKKMERSYIRVFAANSNGVGNDILVPMEYGKIITNASVLKRDDQHTQILYSVLIDRFVNGNKQNDSKLNIKEVLPKVDYWGGDISGIEQKIKEGWFDTLGVTTIWISPITQNPYDSWGQYEDPKTKFSGYHGYWPVYVTKIDNRFGTEEELKSFLASAHKDNKNVILDYVSNHIHINSPTLKAHPDWVTPSVTPDGRPNFELWDEFRLTTWFDKHIPSLDLEKPYVFEPMTDSALYWMREFDFDGFRHDATKHIPEIFWRTLTRKLHDSIPERVFYQIGETYGARELIASYVKPGMLDAQFDFNIYDTFIWATTAKNGSFIDLANTIKADLDVYGYHNLMGNITGNHDRARYVSIAGGSLKEGEDYKKAGWKRVIDAGNPISYQKLKLLHVMNMTLPGVPCIYYGDEYGQPGANDPDNRRWMQFEGYSANEQDVFNTVKKLTQMRRHSMPLLYGDYFQLLAEDDILVYMRSYMGKYVIIGLNKGMCPAEREIMLPKGFEYEGKNQVVVSIVPVSFQIIENR